MLDFHIKLAQFIEPSGQLPLRFLEVHQPGQTVVVRPDREMSSQQVVSKLSGEPDYRQQFFAGGTIFLLLRSQCKTRVCNCSFFSPLNLNKLGPH